MGIASGVVVFVVIWWVLFYIALPIGVQQDSHVERGNDRGAPKHSYLLWKLLGTTLISTVLWFIVRACLESIHKS